MRFTCAGASRIGGKRGLVLGDRACHVATPLEGLRAVGPRRRVVAQRADRRHHRVLYGRPLGAELLRARERLACLVEPAQPPQLEPARVPGGSEFGVQPHRGVELAQGRFMVPLRREHPAEPPARVRLGCRNAGRAPIELAAVGERAGLELRIREREPRGHRVGRERHRLSQKLRCPRVMRQARLHEAAEIEPVEPALERPRASVRLRRRVELLPGVQHHARAARRAPHRSGCARASVSARAIGSRETGGKLSIARAGRSCADGPLAERTQTASVAQQAHPESRIDRG